MKLIAIEIREHCFCSTVAPSWLNKNLNRNNLHVYLYHMIFLILVIHISHTSYSYTCILELLISLSDLFILINKFVYTSWIIFLFSLTLWTYILFLLCPSVCPSVTKFNKKERIWCYNSVCQYNSPETTQQSSITFGR